MKMWFTFWERKGERDPKCHAKNMETLRRTCVVMGIWMLTALAVVTVLSILTVMKTRYVYTRLIQDINEERHGVDVKTIFVNMEKLCQSADLETMYFAGCLVLSAISLQYTIAFTLLLIGLFWKKNIPIYIWLFISTMLTLFLTCAAVVIPLSDTFANVSSDIVCWLRVVIATISIYTILVCVYANMLEKSGNKEESVIVESYGGYRHTVSSPTNSLPEKHPNNYIV